MRRAALLLLALAACRDEGAERRARVEEARALAPRLHEPEAFARAVELGETGPLLDATSEGSPEATRCLAALALGRIGGGAARARLAELARGEGRVSRCAYAALDGLTPGDLAAREAREAEAAPLVERLEDEAAFARVVELRAVGPLVAATREGRPDRIRRLACLALGKVGGAEARDRLLALLAAPTPEPRVQGAMRLYAAAGLTILGDPGTAVDLVNQLSTVNPNDNVAALAGEGVESDYYTVDAQICDALLGMGLWTAEDELVLQLRRRDKVRVLIDAYAALRRHTGIDLPFRYNGGYPDRKADADAWAKRLKETRAERMKARPFDGSNPRFRERVGDMLDWLGGKAVNERYIAEKVFVRLGPPAVPFLCDGLAEGNPSLERECALVLGRIGDPSAAPALRDALALKDAKARARVLDALRLLGDRQAVGGAAKRLLDPDPEVRANAARLLGALGDATHADALRQVLAKETAPATIVQLSIALSRLGDPQAERLLDIFVNGEQLDRQAAYEELKRLQPEWKGDPLAGSQERAEAAGGFPQ